MSETVLITGASSGIGLELARLFASEHCDLILVARGESKLNELRSQLVDDHSIHVEVIVMDLAQVDAASRLVDELAERKLVVDVLVNNAGFGDLGKFADLLADRQLEMTRLNVVTVVQLSRLLLPGMIKRNRGGILNVASTAAFQPGPNMAVYYATKAFVLSFSEALHEELINTNIKVSCLAPGPTQTGFGADSGMENSRLFQLGVMDARKVAQIGYRAFRKNKALVIPGFRNWLGAFLNRLVPRIVIRKVVKRLQPIDKAGTRAS